MKVNNLAPRIMRRFEKGPQVLVRSSTGHAVSAIGLAYQRHATIAPRHAVAIIGLCDGDIPTLIPAISFNKRIRRAQRRGQYHRQKHCFHGFKLPPIARSVK